MVAAFDLRKRIASFTRCLKCNGVLRRVYKSEIEHELPPHTRESYDRYLRCEGCGALYWPGAHYQRLRSIVANLVDRMPSSL